MLSLIGSQSQEGLRWDGRLTSGTRDVHSRLPSSPRGRLSCVSAAINQDLSAAISERVSNFESENKFFLCSRQESLERRRRNILVSKPTKEKYKVTSIRAVFDFSLLFVRSFPLLAHINPRETREEQGKMNSGAEAEAEGAEGGVAWQGV